jgi:hypothetical protein
MRGVVIRLLLERWKVVLLIKLLLLLLLLLLLICQRHVRGVCSLVHAQRLRVERKGPPRHGVIQGRCWRNERVF